MPGLGCVDLAGRSAFAKRKSKNGRRTGYRPAPCDAAAKSRDNRSAAASPPAVDSDQPKTRIHIVQKGETLSAISKQYYGSSNKWQKIFDANRSILKNPESLAPGMKLIIPD